MRTPGQPIFSKKELVIYGALAVVTVGALLVIPLVLWLWRTDRRPVAIVIAVVALAAALTLGALTDTPKKSATNPPTAAQNQAEPAAPEGQSDVDEHTRAYVGVMQSCMVSIGLLIVDLQQTPSQSDVDFADHTTTARNLCDDALSRLVDLNTDHFTKEADHGFYGIDRSKSGLNALLAYIDSGAPTKLIEARNKFQEGDQVAAEAVDQINQRRAAYGLPPIKT